MATPHKHADVIIAWANGAEVQHMDQMTGEWIDNPDPLWCPLAIYRVKPKRVKKEGWVNVCPDVYEGYVTHYHHTEERANQLATQSRVACVRIEWEEEE